MSEKMSEMFEVKMDDFLGKLTSSIASKAYEEREAGLKPPVLETQTGAGAKARSAGSCSKILEKVPQAMTTAVQRGRGKW